MRRFGFAVAAAVALSMVAPLAAKPIVIGHRGASGERPEHTLAAYELAIAQGADFIEPDLVMTKDGVLVARHENEISGTTDVASKPAFASRKTTKTIDGEAHTGWFTEDFTLAELKTLRAKERLPELRPGNTAYDGQFEVPTFAEILTLAREAGARTGREIGVYSETKHPDYFDSIGLAHEGPLLAALAAFGHHDADAPIFIQSFEAANLMRLRPKTKLRLVQLVANTPAAAAMLTRAGLEAIAGYADGLGPEKSLIVPVDKEGKRGVPTSLIEDAHAAGLVVHPWTFRAENYFLSAELKRGGDPRAQGDLAAELKQFYDLGVDGVFSDFPGVAVAARD